MDSRDHVRRYEDADALSVFKYREKIEGQPPAFLQCGGFVYPLVRGKSPILKSGERMYMFPELRGEGEYCTPVLYLHVYIPHGTVGVTVLALCSYVSGCWLEVCVPRGVAKSNCVVYCSNLSGLALSVDYS